MEFYNESPEIGNPYRKDYVSSIENYIKALQDASAEIRENFMPTKDFLENIELYREKYKNMLGEPLASYKAGVCPEAEEIDVGEDDLCTIKRVVVYALSGFKFYGMIFIPKKRKEKAPLVIAQHGGGGTPELCSDINGKNNYSHMLRRVVQRGAVAFAPQLLLWNCGKEGETVRSYDVQYNRGDVDFKLKQLGGSIQALEIFCILRCIDYMQNKSYIDSEKIGMIGLSYGGFYTVYTMAADTRIKCGYSCSAYNDRYFHFRTDWSWKNSGNTFLDGEVAALCAPRRLTIEVGKADPVFDYKTAEKTFPTTEKYYEAAGKRENLRCVVWDGSHTVNSDDSGYDFMFEILNK